MSTFLPIESMRVAEVGVSDSFDIVRRPLGSNFQGSLLFARVLVHFHFAFLGNNLIKMSHSVTITRTTVATSGTSVYVNTGYLGTLPGLLKLAELLLGAACVGVVAYYIDRGGYYYVQRPEIFFLLVATTFLIGTFCLLLSCLVSMSTASIISKTIYEVIYHGFAFIFYLCAGLTLIIEVNHRSRKNSREYEAYFAASIMGLVMAALYLMSTFLANRQYRGI